MKLIDLNQKRNLNKYRQVVMLFYGDSKKENHRDVAMFVK